MHGQQNIKKKIKG